MTSNDSCFMSYFAVPSKEVSHMYFHPDQEKILVSAKRGGLLMYDYTKKATRPFSFTADNFIAVKGMVFPETRNVVGASFKGKLGLWHSHSEKPVKVCTGHGSSINDMDMHIQSSCIATASNDKSIKIWDSELNFISSFTQHNSQVTTIAFRQNDGVIISGDKTGITYLLNPKKQKEPIWKFQMWPGSKDSVKHVAFDKTGDYCGILSEVGEFAILDIRDPEKTIIPPFSMQPHHFSFSKNHPYVLYGDVENPCNCSIFDYDLGSVLFSFEGHKDIMVSSAWSSKGNKFATADASGTIIVWNVPKRPKLKSIKNCLHENVTLLPQAPSITASPEVLLEEIDILNLHIAEYEEKLNTQNLRMGRLISEYRWRD